MAKQSMAVIGEALQEVFARKDGLKQVLELLVNSAMRDEATAHLGAAPHERSDARRGHRNGAKPRTLNTRVGELALSVPQVRGCEPYHPSMFNRWQRSERALLVACAEMYFQGVSTRNVREVLEAMCDGEVSSMTVSRVAGEVDEKLGAFRDRRLDAAAYPYLMIDARYEKVRVEGRVVSQAVLVVMGVTCDGRKEILDFAVGDSESEQAWGDCFRRLKDRGLGGVTLVVSDAHAGIRAAMTRHFQGVAWQRCRVHFKRELRRKVSYRVAKELMADAASAFAPAERVECLRRAQEAAEKWQGRCPAVAAMFRDGFEDCLSVLDVPANHRRQLAGTNLLENLMKRLKKRTAVVGVFPNRASCARLAGAQLIEVHEDWQTEARPYLCMGQAPATAPTAGLV
ncbi:MAG: transposase [Phycisphaerales bacterium]|nr:transposase [Phycisphaerales bacterium]